MSRYYYKASLQTFLSEDSTAVLGTLACHHEFSLEEQQRNAWTSQVSHLKRWLTELEGTILLEYSIPRMGRRIDAVVLSGSVVFAIEFKVGAKAYERSDIDQVMDYALDLKNFHEQSHSRIIVPILICTEAPDEAHSLFFYEDRVTKPILTNGNSLKSLIQAARIRFNDHPIDPEQWAHSTYKPTPTIIEAAQALYERHTVEDISRSDAGAINLSKTTAAIAKIIDHSKNNSRKSICFVTGVPGAGKTLAGLNLAISWHNTDESQHAVFLSGNGPLVDVLREALTKNTAQNAKLNGSRSNKNRTRSETKAFIQNIHHFRDDALNVETPPVERVVVFDEAQRAWTVKQTAAFMKTKKGRSDFQQSEPEFLISVMNRHTDWATIICLIGGGQEINTGEAGLHEWFASLQRSFPEWDIYISGQLTDTEYTQGRQLYDALDKRLFIEDDLHLSVSIRSFRAESVAAFVKAILDANTHEARVLFSKVASQYPIVLTRDLMTAKQWLRSKARGSERFGIVASSGAIRLKPLGLNVKSTIDPTHWFLNDKNDVRSSFFLEDVATEFVVQGLELDWTCVAWDANLRYGQDRWVLKAFRGTTWQEINDSDARLFLKNAYRVLLTRARQGMVILIPRGDSADPTRHPDFYDPTFEYLQSIGIPVLPETRSQE